ncbi:hypothetical protein ANCDUO_04260 [Ancylostoma duodenale]|uniref:Uncharacterized protein n=1 Tax=Ancylostoma duodenale TaxID=51022 RepID=A0A0C2H7L9_9BILA|nr:hypothetical protein ANCDUO_04260 [Ancylostoma duodenale]
MHAHVCRTGSEDDGSAKKNQQKKPTSSSGLTVAEDQLKDYDNIHATKEEDSDLTANESTRYLNDQASFGDSSRKSQKKKSQRSQDFPTSSIVVIKTVKGQLTDGNEANDYRNEGLRSDTKELATKLKEPLTHGEFSKKAQKEESQPIQEVSRSSAVVFQSVQEHLTNNSGTRVAKNDDVLTAMKPRSKGQTSANDSLTKDQKEKIQQSQRVLIRPTTVSGSLENQVEAANEDETLSTKKEDFPKKNQTEQLQQNQEISTTVVSEAGKRILAEADDNDMFLVKKEEVGSAAEKPVIKSKDQTPDKLRRKNSEEKSHQSQEVSKASTVVDEAATERVIYSKKTLFATKEDSRKRNQEERSQQSDEVSTLLAFDNKAVEEHVIDGNEGKEASDTRKEVVGSAGRKTSPRLNDKNRSDKLSKKGQEEKSEQSQECFAAQKNISESVNEQIRDGNDASNRKSASKSKDHTLPHKLRRKEQEEKPHQIQAVSIASTNASETTICQVAKEDHNEKTSAKNENVGLAVKKPTHKFKDQTLSDKLSEKVQEDKPQRSQEPPEPSTAISEAFKNEMFTADNSETLSAKEEDVGSQTKENAPLSKSQAPPDDPSMMDQREKSQTLSATEEDVESQTKENAPLSKSQAPPGDSSMMDQREKSQNGQESSTPSTIPNETVQQPVINDSETVSVKKRDSPTKAQKEELKQSLGVLSSSTNVSEVYDNEASYARKEDIGSASKKTAPKSQDRKQSVESPKKDQEQESHKSSNAFTASTSVSEAVEARTVTAHDNEMRSVKKEDFGLSIKKTDAESTYENLGDELPRKDQERGSQRSQNVLTSSTVAGEAVKISEMDDNKSSCTGIEYSRSGAKEHVTTLMYETPSGDSSKKDKKEKQQQGQDVLTTPAVISEAVKEKTMNDSEISHTRKDYVRSAAVEPALELKGQSSSENLPRKDQEEKLHETQAVPRASSVGSEAVEEWGDNEKRSTEKEDGGSVVKKTAAELKFDKSADNLPRKDHEQKLQQSNDVSPASTVVTEAVNVQIIDDSETLSTKIEGVESKAKKPSLKPKIQTSSDNSSKKGQKRKLQKSQEPPTRSTVVSEAVEKQVLDDNEKGSSKKEDGGLSASKTAAELKLKNSADNLPGMDQEEKSPLSEEFTPTPAVVSEAVKVRVIDDLEALSAKIEEVELAVEKPSVKLGNQTSSKNSSKKEQKEKSQKSQETPTLSTVVSEALNIQVLDDNEKGSFKKEDGGSPEKKTAAELKLKNSADNILGKDQRQKSQQSKDVFAASTVVTEDVKVQVIDDSKTLSAKVEDVESASEKPSAKSKSQTSSKNSTKQEQKEKLQKSQEVSTLSTVVSKTVKGQLIDDNETLPAEKKGIGSPSKRTLVESNNENPSDKLQREELAEKSQSENVSNARTAVNETVKDQVIDNKTTHTKEEDLDSAGKSTAPKSNIEHSLKKSHDKSQKSQEVLPPSTPVSGSVKEEIVVGTEASCGMEKSVELSAMKSPAKLKEQTTSTKSPKKKAEESKKQLGDGGRVKYDEHVESEESEIEFSKFEVKHSSGTSSLGTCGLAEDEASVRYCFPIPLTVRVEMKVVSNISESVAVEPGSFPSEKLDNEESNSLEDSCTNGAKLEVGSPALLEAGTTTLSSFAQRQPLSRKHSKKKPKSYISKETEKLLRRKAKAKQNSSLEIDNVAGNSAPTDDLFALSLKKVCDEFGNQSTDPMTDQPNDSDFVMERSEPETIIGGGPKFTAADEHPKKNQQCEFTL